MPRAKHRRTKQAKALPGLKRAQTGIRAHKKKRLPATPENPIVDDGEFDFDRPPSCLNVDGVELWRSVVSVLRKAGELHSSDRFGLETLCYRFQKMRKKRRAEQDIPVHEEKLFERLLAEYGLTPVSRAHRIDPHGKLRANGAPSKGFGPTGKNKEKIFEEQNLRSEAPDSSDDIEETEEIERPHAAPSLRVVS